ncbi:hypothetical protein ACJIZ3_004520 [Penstemon smallii]|uniref:EamA domain-containing protein n=1 Tax=Penstemon smallii TaxID=265156 RepID=A0ABD3S2C3_9LAMI
MTFLSSGKILTDSAAVATIHCFFHPCGYQKITHITISSSKTVNFASAISRKKLTVRSSKNGKNGESYTKGLVQTLKQKSCSKERKLPSLRKLLFGSKKLRSIILLNAVTVISASNIAVIKEVEALTDPAYFSAVRFAVSTIPFLPFIIRARNDCQTRNSGLELGLWVSLAYLSEALGLVTADAGRASFISLFTVIVIPLLESILGEIIPARTWFGILMSVLGIFMLESSGSPPNIGDLFNFLSAIFFGIHTLRTEHISRTTRKENFLALLGYEVGVISALSTIWCLTGAHFDEISWTWALLSDWLYAFPWIPALYTGVFSTGLCLWGEVVAMQEVSATETAVIYGLEPLWGAGFAWFLLGERWGIAGWIGAALILGGSITVQMFGALAGEMKDDSKREKDDEKLRKALSTSPLVVSSRDNVMDVLKK